jgi:hypothetical protein
MDLMSFKLSKADLGRRDALIEQLRELGSKLEDAVTEYNAKAEITFPDSLDDPAPTHADDLEGLPVELDP